MDIETWARDRWEQLLTTSSMSRVATAVLLASEAYEKGRKGETATEEHVQYRATVHPPRFTTTVPLAYRPASSMTVLECMAMAAMQGLCSRQGDQKVGEITKAALLLADALIAALEEKKP